MCPAVILEVLHFPQVFSMTIALRCHPQETRHRALKPSFQDTENANIAEGSFSRQRSTRHNFHCTEMTFGFGLIS